MSTATPGEGVNLVVATLPVTPVQWTSISGVISVLSGVAAQRVFGYALGFNQPELPHGAADRAPEHFGVKAVALGVL